MKLLVGQIDSSGSVVGDYIISKENGDITRTGTVQKYIDTTPGITTFETNAVFDDTNDVYHITATIVGEYESYTGAVGEADYTLTAWSFITDDGTIVTLGGNGMQLTIQQHVTEPANSAYGYVNLAQKTQPDPVQRESVTIPTSTLNISKSVSGEGASDTEEFSMTVTFTPGGTDKWNVRGITPPAGAEGDNGVFTLSLSARDGIVSFTNVPVGTTYSITETISEAQDNAGWTAGTSTGLSGPVGTNGANAIVANEYTKQEVAGASDDGTTETPSPSPSAATGETGVKGDADILPQTGGISTSSLLGLLGLALVGVGGTTFVIFRKKFLSNSN